MSELNKTPLAQAMGQYCIQSDSDLLVGAMAKPITPQELLYAWQKHLSEFQATTEALTLNVKATAEASHNEYVNLEARVKHYEQMLQNITMDDLTPTFDDNETNFTGWTILNQAAHWDYQLKKYIDSIKESVGTGMGSIKDEVLNGLPSIADQITNIIDALSEAPIIKALDEAIQAGKTTVSNLQAMHNELREKQYKDALDQANLINSGLEALDIKYNELIGQQINAIAEEAVNRAQSLTTLSDGISLKINQLQQDGETLNSYITSVKSETESSFSAVQDELTALASVDEALAQSTQEAIAQVNDNIAVILTDYVAYANLDSALVAKTDELVAIVRDNVTKLNIENSIAATDRSTRALSMVSINQNGVISGYGLISDLIDGKVTSGFGVDADYFYVGSPANGGTKPFLVTSTPVTVDGVTYPAGTWINTAIIANASIGNAQIADATITSAKIKDASITSAKIQDLGADKITSGTIDAARIGANTITADKLNVSDLSAISANLGTLTVHNANIADLSVDSAKIVDASITNAKIANLSVDSLKIRDQAVTVTVAGVGVSELTINTDGGIVFIDVGIETNHTASGGVAGFHYIRLYRNGFAIKTYELPGVTSGEYLIWNMCQTLATMTDSPPKGSHVYSVKVTSVVSNGVTESILHTPGSRTWVTLDGVSMRLLEIKK